MFQFIFELFHHGCGWEQAAVIRKYRIPQGHPSVFKRGHTIADDFGGSFRRNRADRVAKFIQHGARWLGHAGKIRLYGFDRSHFLCGRRAGAGGWLVHENHSISPAGFSAIRAALGFPHVRQRDVGDRVPSIVNADEQQQQRSSGHHEQRRTRMPG
jgi:hypothetical protein